MIAATCLSGLLALQVPVVQVPTGVTGRAPQAPGVGTTLVDVPGGGQPTPPNIVPQHLARSLIDTVPFDDPTDIGLYEIQAAPGTILLVSQDTSGPAGTPIYNVDLVRTGTGYKENYRIQLPPKVGFEPSPLLVAFHGFGQSTNAVVQQTSYADECAARNWFLVIPLGASKKGFGALPCQENIELVLDQVLQVFHPFIDRERIYSVGFSMGGGDALNFAARHLDPSRYIFAATANHTGGLNRKFGYWTDPATQWIYEFWHGSDPNTVPFLYEQTGVIDFDLSTFVIDPTTDLGRNLTYMPVRSYQAQFDPLVVSSGLSQGTIFTTHMQALGGSNTFQTVPGIVHAWETVDEVEVCDFLERQHLQRPRTGQVLADRDEVWWYFHVQQDAPGAWTPFDFDIDVPQNRVDIGGTANLARITIAPNAAGLDPTQTLTVGIAAADGLADEVDVLAIANAPAQVLRDGAPTAAWGWNAATQVLTLYEFDPGAHTWVVQP